MQNGHEEFGELVERLLAERGIDPVAQLLELLPTLDPEKQADIYMRMIELIYSVPEEQDEE